MKIHSSSLHVSPSGQQANQAKQPSEQGQINDAQVDKNPRTPSSSQEFASAADREHQQQLTQVANSKNTQTPLNAQALKAVSAYTETFNDFIHQQVSAKITGIDFYV
ncbi:MAG: hypothetical protein PSN04_00820 [Methyloprofundus sp.]|nr:hypothetical protein [Methyloprofundus sp.]